MEPLRPVIRWISPVPHLKNGPERVRRLGRIAREAACRSAAISDAPPPSFLKTFDGVPLPEAGWHWSITHKPTIVAGIVAREPVGIDIETIRPVHPNLHLKICNASEWALGREPALLRFFRFWTAKEAVLKAVGLGLQGLSICRICSAPASPRMALDVDGDPWRVEHLFISDHLVAVASKGRDVAWTLHLAS